MTSGGNGPELLEAGPPRVGPGARRRRLLLLAAVVVVLLLVGTAVRALSPDAPAGARDQSPAPTASSRPSTAPASTRAVPTAPVVLPRAAARVPGFPRGDLYARDAQHLYRVELATGRVTATAADLGPDGPVEMVPGPDGVVLRPLDPGPGLRVRDGRAARELEGRLRTSTQVLPGPGSRLWVSESFDGRSSEFTLTDVDGRPLGDSVRENGYFASDATGGLLLVDNAGVWERRHGSWRRISSGILVATGAGQHLLARCEGDRCQTYRYDRRTGRTSRVLRATPLTSGGGTLSPDGRFVATATSVVGEPVTQVVEVGTGRVVTRVVTRTAAATRSQLVWSADGRRLVGLDDGQLFVLDLSSGAVVRPDLGLPALLGIALRP